MTQQPTNKLHIVPNKTKLCVEGFPRSANSTLSWEINRLNKDLYFGRNVFAHHSHSTAQIRLAIQNKIPTFVLIRNPVDAIVSYHIYSGRPISDCATMWFNFYTQIQGIRNRFELIKFDDIVADQTKVASHILEKAGLGLSGDDEHKELIAGKRKKSLQNDPKRTSAPVESRAKTKDVILESIDQKLFAPSVALYDFYLDHASKMQKAG